jgi:DNA-binding transcriptional LysR family regulator
MNTDIFLEFSVLAEIESYNEAADQLLISESALSRHIQGLEDELGVRLFDRTSRKVRINKYGKIFLPYAQRFIAMQHEYFHDIEKVKKGKETVFICSSYYIDDFLFKFHSLNNSMAVTHVNSDNNNSDKWPYLLRRGVCELAFVTDPVDGNNEFTVVPFETDCYVAVLPKSHSFATRKSLPLSELSDEKFISFKENSHSDSQLKKLCRGSGFDPKISFNTDTGSAIASFVKNGMGVSILLKKTLSKMNVTGVTLVNIEPKAVIHVCICHLKAAVLSRGAKSLLQFSTDTWPEIKRKKD